MMINQKGEMNMATNSRLWRAGEKKPVTVVAQARPNFACSKEDQELIFKIVNRAKRELAGTEATVTNVAHLIMDLTAAHNDTPMDLALLLSFPSFDFVHDVLGIQRHINRETGTLEDCFLPRCARNQS
jgi:hypothetical protein